MSGEERREKIISTLKNSETPVSGSGLMNPSGQSVSNGVETGTSPSMVSLTSKMVRVVKMPDPMVSSVVTSNRPS